MTNMTMLLACSAGFFYSYRHGRSGPNDGDRHGFSATSSSRPRVSLSPCSELGPVDGSATPSSRGRVSHRPLWETIPTRFMAPRRLRGMRVSVRDGMKSECCWKGRADTRDLRVGLRACRCSPHRAEMPRQRVVDGQLRTPDEKGRSRFPPPVALGMAAGTSQTAASTLTPKPRLASSYHCHVLAPRTLRTSFRSKENARICAVWRVMSLSCHRSVILPQ